MNTSAVHCKDTNTMSEDKKENASNDGTNISLSEPEQQQEGILSPYFQTSPHDETRRKKKSFFKKLITKNHPKDSPKPSKKRNDFQACKKPRQD